MSDVATRLAAALADRYRLDRELGGGGMSRIWVATETALDRQVVVKVIASELSEGLSAERFTREVRLAARLQQANIVPVLHAGTAAGLPYYTMPYVRGESLRARMTDGAPLSLAERVAILRDVARALAYAHGEGVVHRDIKPENVLLSHGAAMVTDFGIAKALTASRTQDGDVAVTLTQAGGSIGTPAYMAPEQAVGGSIDQRTDLYAWGVMAYELLTGGHPFGRHTTPQQLIAAHIAEPPTPIAGKSPALPPALAALVMQCLEKDPARRPDSATAVLTAFEIQATPVPSVPRPAANAPRLRMTGVLVVAGLVVAALVVWALRPGRDGTAPSHGAEQSLAVLPLANLSGDKADDYFGIGLAEEITRAVAKNGVRVIGRVSAGALQARGLDERAIANELGVGSLLTGTVQRADSQIRITVTLVSANDGAVRWTEKYDRPLANVFAVQDEIARTVAATLLGSLGRRSSPTVTRVETADPEALSLFLQGRVLSIGAGPGRSISRSSCSSGQPRGIPNTRGLRRHWRWPWPCCRPTCWIALRRSWPARSPRPSGASRRIRPSRSRTPHWVMPTPSWVSFAAPRRTFDTVSRSIPRWPPPGAGTDCWRAGWASTRRRTTGLPEPASSSRPLSSRGFGKPRSWYRNAASRRPIRWPAPPSPWIRPSCWRGRGGKTPSSGWER